jgi:hypothetical protein
MIKRGRVIRHRKEGRPRGRPGASTRRPAPRALCCARPLNRPPPFAAAARGGSRRRLQRRATAKPAPAAQPCGAPGLEQGGARPAAYILIQCMDCGAVSGPRPRARAAQYACGAGGARALCKWAAANGTLLGGEAHARLAPAVERGARAAAGSSEGAADGEGGSAQAAARASGGGGIARPDVPWCVGAGAGGRQAALGAARPASRAARWREGGRCSAVQRCRRRRHASIPWARPVQAGPGVRRAAGARAVDRRRPPRGARARARRGREQQGAQLNCSSMARMACTGVA